jgi:hypothetical protein
MRELIQRSDWRGSVEGRLGSRIHGNVEFNIISSWSGGLVRGEIPQTALNIAACSGGNCYRVGLSGLSSGMDLSTGSWRAWLTLLLPCNVPSRAGWRP